VLVIFFFFGGGGEGGGGGGGGLSVLTDQNQRTEVRRTWKLCPYTFVNTY